MLRNQNPHLFAIHKVDLAQTTLASNHLLLIRKLYKLLTFAAAAFIAMCICDLKTLDI